MDQTGTAIAGVHARGTSPLAQVGLACRMASEAVEALQEGSASRPIDWAEVTRELVQLRPVLNQLIALAAKDHAPSQAPQPATLTDVLRNATADLSPLMQATGREIELDTAEVACTSPVGDELREAIHALLEASLAMGTGPVRVLERVERGANDAPYVLVEVINDSLDVPDRVRRKLSKAVSAHAGQISFVTARSGSCVRIRLPMLREVSVAAAA